MKNDIELLERMLADELRQPDIYRPGPYWQPYENRIVAAVRKHGIENFRSRPGIGKGFIDAPSVPEELWLDTGTLKNSIRHILLELPGFKSIINDYKRAIRTATNYRYLIESQWYEAQMSDIDLPDTLTAGAADLAFVNGQTVSGTYLLFLSRIRAYAKHIDLSKIRTIFEIGGGYGAWPHLMTHLYPNIRKIVCLDLPPMAYLTAQYLSQFFKVLDYGITEFSDNDDLEIMCLCPWQIEQLNLKTDLLWNAASFGEMTSEIVENYAKHVLRTKPDHICIIFDDGEAVDGRPGRDKVLKFFDCEFKEIPPVIAGPQPTHNLGSPNYKLASSSI